MNIQDIDKEYVANTYARFDVNFTEGKGSLLYDEKGKEYIDLCSGIAVNTFGVADEEWKEAVINQVNKLQHVSNLYFTAPQTKLAEMLCQKTGAKKVFFSNSGAEANECMIKIARKYASDKGKPQNIITLKNSFHGRTITTLAATGQDTFHKDFGPFTQGFFYAEPNNIEDMKNLIDEVSPCAIMVELVQGEGGVCVLHKEYVKKIRQITKEKDILFLIDEVQTGNGRTGSLYAYQQFDIKPDVVSTAKGLAGGLPMGATLIFEKAEDVLKSGDHGSTFGGNPVSAAGAISILSRIDENVLTEVKAKGAYIYDTLIHSSGVKDISGLGLMIGILPEKRCAKDIVKSCLDKGVVLLTAKDRVRLLPPLNIEQGLLEKAIDILKEELEK